MSLNKSINGVGPVLGSPTQKSGVQVYNSKCNLEITLNFPRTTVFKNAKSDSQKALYLRLLQIIKCTFGPTTLEECEYTFEYCKNGHIHMHASLLFNFPHLHIPIGVVSDVVKTYLKQLPKRYSNYQEGSMFVNYIRYKSPSITVQYVSIEDSKRSEIWKTYINKYQ